MSALLTDMEVARLLGIRTIKTWRALERSKKLPDPACTLSDGPRWSETDISRTFGLDPKTTASDVKGRAVDQIISTL